MKKRRGTEAKDIMLYNVGKPDARLFSLDECREIGMTEFGKRIVAPFRKRILGVIDTLLKLDDAGKYRMLTRLHRARRPGRKGQDAFMSALAFHLLLNPHLLPELAVGIGYEKGTPAKQARPRAAA